MEASSGTIDQALWNASLLLLKAPRAAIEQAEEILHAVPGHVGAQLVLAKAHRICENPERAAQAVHAVFARFPEHTAARRELALISLLRGETATAIEHLHAILGEDRNDTAAWSVLADIHRMSGEAEAAELATRTSIDVAVNDRECLAAALALGDGRLPDAEHLLRLRLRDYPTEVTTIRMMAELATRLGRMADAERLLRRALDIAPYFQSARELLARNLQRSNRPVDALVEVDILLADAPEDPSLQMLKASLLVKTGDQEAARNVYEDVLARHPKQAKGWMSLGHVLKTLGHNKEAIDAYRRAIRELPTLGEAWWSLANLKTFRFTQDEVATMESALRQSTEEDDRLHLHFALGKANEDAEAYEAAFTHWKQGNALRRKSLPYDGDETHQATVSAKAFFDKSVLNVTSENPAADPVFILGLPRSGSTLVEQILASHSQVEGTMELPDMMEIASRLSVNAKRTGRAYPDMLASLSKDELSALGEEYLERTRVHRKTDRPYFIDKMPNNWAHVGLIRMILPRARIIDTRRHPLGCCLSVWKQHFARGQAFSYDLKDVARYYRDYVDLMAHFDQVMPGLVHRVIYERMVADSATEIGKLLDYIGLPFEEACLSFWQNDRAVRTASSEQVRQPIFADAVDHWRHFEPWLEPLKFELGALIEAYPGGRA